MPYLAFAAYAALSLLMVNDPRRPLLPSPLAGKTWVAWKGILERPLVGWGPDAWPRLLEWAKGVGHARERLGFQTGQTEPFTIAAEMGLVGLAVWTAFWVLCLRWMWTVPGDAFAGMLARYQALGSGAALLTSVHLDIMRVRFLWISLALGLAAAACARTERAAP